MANFFSAETVEKRQQQYDQKHSNHGSQKGEKNRFSKKLANELPTHRSEHLFDSHLLGSHGGSCCRQVHEIDASNDQNKQSNCAENVHVLHASIGLDFNGQMRIEVNIGHWLKIVVDMIATCHHLIKVHTHHFFELRSEIFFIHGGKFRFKACFVILRIQ